MKLIIVESPTKAKTIGKFLPKDFEIASSFGHIRDLPAYELGVDAEKGFEPHYVVPKKARPAVKNLKQMAIKSSDVILATDEDREGEAIAWHITQALGLRELKAKGSKLKAVERIVFHEITKRAIEDALKNPREINMNLVDAQQARRILDRLVGYKLSPFLWRKVMRGLSAGRVQSVALRLIVERETQIKAFTPVTFWTIETEVQKKGCADQKGECLPFKAQLESVNKKSPSEPGFTDKEEVDLLVDDLKKAEFKSVSVDKKSRKRNPLPPFTTSTLQQDAYRRLGYSAKRTMMSAQRLYETGFITYMRTDSVNLAQEALNKAEEFIKKEFGENFSSRRVFKTKSRLAQEAHEAVRPTNPELDPQKAAGEITDRSQFKLYDLIWRRFTASQMAEAVFDETVIKIEARNKNVYELKAAGSVISFEGFLKVYPSKAEDVILPNLEGSADLNLLGLESVERQTRGPARYSDATLVKELEKLGIGRPSTYAPIISTIEERGYVVRDEKKSFQPTEIGEKVNEILVKNFSEIVDVDFTRKMEGELDEIAEGKKETKEVLTAFYEPFIKNLNEKYQSVVKEDLSLPTDRKCPECSKPLVIRQGRFGKFIACSGFPECKYTEALPPPTIDMKCPICKEGEVVVRQTRRKRTFYGCSKWPECSFASWRKPTGKLCIECGSPLVESVRGEKCPNKNCSFRAKKEKV
ncbi:MAG: type I DNA topoisomerase [Candidatus Niyogibacteria bacterium]|nr:MAG: type I DNA topoisomerase [Candidatus Niyogibacteria bacterium]